MKFRFGCDLSYTVLEATTFIFNVEAAVLPRHVALNDHLTCVPDLTGRRHTVPDLNTRYFGIRAEPGPFSLRYRGELDLDVLRADPQTLHETPIDDIPLDILPYLLPSRFVPSDRLAAFAAREFGNAAKGHVRISRICNWIHDNIEYRPGSSNAETIASETLILRAGVCRDFAHLGIAFCRALDIPARYVTCYAYGLQPSDFHAVFEAYLDGRWWLFDPTRQAALDGLVRIGAGRDAAEAAFSTHFGSMEAGQHRVWIEKADASREVARTTDAISTDARLPTDGAGAP